MSDSGGDLPSEATIANKLRDVVIAIHKSGKPDDLTVKRVRVRAEQELDLPEGFFKTHPSWKQKSQAEIVEAVEKYCHDEPTPKSTPKKAAAKPTPKPKPVAKKATAPKATTKGIKRKAAIPVKKVKKARKLSSDEESEAELSEPLAEFSDAESEPPKKLAQRGKKTVAEDSDDGDAPKSVSKRRAAVEDNESESAPSVMRTPAKSRPAPKDDKSDSELSSLDDGPPPKKRQKKDASTKSKKETKPTQPKAKAAKPKPNDDPETAEIKRLQGWLVKCGIRKVWAKDPELNKCDTPKEKITVLKGMLKDAGMDGKYSVEKAASIKEKREFEKDLAAIQEGEAAWGKANEVTSTGRPSRRAAAKPIPVQKVVFEDDSEDDSGDQDDESEDDGDDDVKADSEDEDDGKDDDSGLDNSE